MLRGESNTITINSIFVISCFIISLISTILLELTNYLRYLSITIGFLGVGVIVMMIMIYLVNYIINGLNVLFESFQQLSSGTENLKIACDCTIEEIEMLIEIDKIEKNDH